MNDTERTGAGAGKKGEVGDCERPRHYVVWDHAGAFESGV